MRRRAITYALLSSALFGASTPLAKIFVGAMPPLALAGLLYLGSAIGLGIWLALRRPSGAPPLAASDVPWLAGAIVAGGILGPALLMYGLARSDAASASLLLNLEAVLTAALAWLVFRENVDRRVFAGMAAIVAAGVVLAWQPMAPASGAAGALLIAGACFAWALDNNLTRRASGGDAVTIAAIKGAVAGITNIALAAALGARMPAPGAIVLVALLGLFGYGVSLVLFIMALRDLGTARTSAYFAVAPFFGALLAVALLGERPETPFWIAAALMALGVWLHLTERHEHDHVHEPLTHAHEHVHDLHHHHEHTDGWDGREPHGHMHHHPRLRHRHPHYPDLHHRHEHE